MQTSRVFAQRVTYIQSVVAFVLTWVIACPVQPISLIRMVSVTYVLSITWAFA